MLNFASYKPHMNENGFALLISLRDELTVLRAEERVSKPKLTSLLDRIENVAEGIVCDDEKTRLLCSSLQGNIATSRKWVNEGDLHFAISSANMGISYFLMNKETFN